MSACSSTVGSSLRSRKHSSVRNRPTPCTGSPPADWADAPSATLASSLRGRPSAVAAGPFHEASSSRSRLLSSTRARASSGSAPCSMVPVSPSTTTKVPLGISMMPAAPTTHGMPSWRAMIAVWLVAPPRSVTSAVTISGSSPEVSLGARSSAMRIDGSFGTGTPGAGSPTRWATTRRSMSRRSVTRSAIRPPMLVKIVTNCSTAPCTAATGPCPAWRFLDTPDRRPLSRARPALAVRTSAAAPWA